MADVHINIISEDGEVYCKHYGDVVKYKKIADMCLNCPLFAGFAQGEGVECEYEDPRGDSETGFRSTSNPYQEKKEQMLAEADGNKAFDAIIEKQSKKLKKKEDDKEE